MAPVEGEEEEEEEAEESRRRLIRLLMLDARATSSSFLTPATFFFSTPSVCEGRGLAAAKEAGMAPSGLGALSRLVGILCSGVFSLLSAGMFLRCSERLTDSNLAVRSAERGRRPSQRGERAEGSGFGEEEGRKMADTGLDLEPRG